MMQPIIKIQNIGKKFRIFHKDAPYLSLRDNIVSYIKTPTKLFRRHTEEFWALKDVSFEIMPGESVGIIGKNGAGKSTLLKILSRITLPTTGEIILRGRVASLLEVGTGFHPELTGRENVFFNGAILGMKRSEIKRKFDEIVAFAGVEKFIDTPLKHYSSGMQLRLAFAVAAFLEAEILVVDEVLAIGDAEFQKKCLGKMEEVTKNEGRTVLFVSHNMGTIRSFCSKGIYLENGKTEGIEQVEHAISKYIGFEQNKVTSIPQNKWKIEELKSKEAKILHVETLSKLKETQQSFRVD
ncbi:MAG: ABC transporter ATP-binding protein, partial [Bacteroidetes bacterium]